MSKRASIEDVLAAASRVDPPLIAIDGLPCSGKSTLAERVRQKLGFDCLYLDDFVMPESDWSPGIKPAFPFEYIRYNAFVAAVTTLASTGECAFAPFDWNTFAISARRRTVKLNKPVIVEGVSALNPVLCPLYGLKIFVESDRATVLDAAVVRGGGAWAREWRELFLPSADIYMQSQPEQRADLRVAGRGIA